MSSYQLNDLLITPAKNSPRAVVILAHGSGAGMRHSFMEAMANALASLELEVIRFNFPYMQQAEAAGKHRPPNRMPVLLEAMQDVMRLVSKLEPSLPLILAGKSMGARVASQLLTLSNISEYRVLASVSFGYPFHPPGKPDKLRLDHFDDIRRPHLVLQGTRDPFGKQQEVKNYPLGENTKVDFVNSGEHSFIPLKSAGTSQQALIQYAAQQTANLVCEQINATHQNEMQKQTA